MGIFRRPKDYRARRNQTRAVLAAGLMLPRMPEYYGYSFDIALPDLANLNMTYYSTFCNGQITGESERSSLQFHSPFFTKSLSGTVLDVNGDPVSGAPVGLYDKSNLKLLMSTVTNASGNYSFTYLLSSQAYFIVVRDPTEVCNAEIYDNLTSGGA